MVARDSSMRGPARKRAAGPWFWAGGRAGIWRSDAVCADLNLRRIDRDARLPSSGRALEWAIPWLPARCRDTPSLLSQGILLTASAPRNGSPPPRLPRALPILRTPVFHFSESSPCVFQNDPSHNVASLCQIGRRPVMRASTGL